jgi:hypothetical protein
MSRPYRTLEDRARDLYDCADCFQAVIESAKKEGTVDRIEAGRLTLPSPQDAHAYHVKLEAEEKLRQLNT